MSEETIQPPTTGTAPTTEKVAFHKHLAAKAKEHINIGREAASAFFKRSSVNLGLIGLGILICLISLVGTAHYYRVHHPSAQLVELKPNQAIVDTSVPIKIQGYQPPVMALWNTNVWAGWTTRLMTSGNPTVETTTDWRGKATYVATYPNGSKYQGDNVNGTTIWKPIK